MKKIYLSLFLTLSLFVSYGQIDFGSLLEGGTEDANVLLGKYLEPAFEGFGYGMNSGWYNTAKPHKLLGFDLTVTANMARVPEGAKFYTLNEADFNNITIRGAENAPNGPYQAPTVFGPNLDADDIPYLVFNEGTDDELSITAPSGLGLDEAIGLRSIPVPAVQLGIGLVKGTEIKLRLIPQQTFGDPGSQFNTSLFGIGLMHDVKQWIPGIKNLPFDLSAFVGYNKFSNTFELDYDSNGDLRTGEFNVSGTTFQGIISKKLAVLTVYGGLGFITSKSDFALLGDFEIDGVPEDPISLEYSSGGVRANAGARLKLAVFTFHAEYALQKYSTFTAGFGISVR